MLFVSLQSPLGSWQAKNWDPTVGSSAFEGFCAALASPHGKSETELLPGGLEIPFTVYNYAKYIKEVRERSFQVISLAKASVNPLQNYVSKCTEGTIDDVSPIL